MLWQNIAVALGIKLVFFALTLAGHSTLWMAVFADMGTSLIVVFNGLRLLGALNDTRARRRTPSSCRPDWKPDALQSRNPVAAEDFSEYNLVAMKRLLVVFLLLSVPFQITWAAVGAYCQHEAGASGKHFGHHAHQHRAVPGDDSRDNPAVKLHPDCGYCFVGGVGVAASTFAIALSPVTVEVRAADPCFLESTFLERLERPKWASRPA